MSEMNPAAPRLPEWLRRPVSHHAEVHALKSRLRGLRLQTVCELARCPNLHECFARGAATFMILGSQCTRGCRFCAVPKNRHPALPDPDEAARVAEAARTGGLRHVVITSVNRDDLPDKGANHFAATIREVRSAAPEACIEVLAPDFQGSLDSLAVLLEAAPDVFNHNLETVPRLYRRVRPGADYRQSLAALRFAKTYRPELLTKSGLMLGLGETRDEIEQVLRDLRACGVEIVTLGQYLQPTRRSLPVAAYLLPEQFDGYRDYARALGFRMVFSGPLVRSSYMADWVHRETAGA